MSCKSTTTISDERLDQEIAQTENADLGAMLVELRQHRQDRDKVEAYLADRDGLDDSDASFADKLIALFENLGRMIAPSKGRDGTKLMPLGQFVNLGALQEINRQFLHPLGLALLVENVAGFNRIAGIWDATEDPEGIIFAEGHISAARARTFRQWQRQQHAKRVATLGYLIEPADDEEPAPRGEPGRNAPAPTHLRPDPPPAPPRLEIHGGGPVGPDGTIILDRPILITEPSVLIFKLDSDPPEADLSRITDYVRDALGPLHRVIILSHGAEFVGAVARGEGEEPEERIETEPMPCQQCGRRSCNCEA